MWRYIGEVGLAPLFISGNGASRFALAFSFFTDQELNVSTARGRALARRDSVRGENSDESLAVNPITTADHYAAPRAGGRSPSAKAGKLPAEEAIQPPSESICLRVV